MIAGFACGRWIGCFLSFLLSFVLRGVAFLIRITEKRGVRFRLARLALTPPGSFFSFFEILCYPFEVTRKCAQNWVYTLAGLLFCFTLYDLDNFMKFMVKKDVRIFTVFHLKRGSNCMEITK